MNRVIFATGNAHKMEEIRAILQNIPLEICSLRDIGFTDEIIEDGDSFEANALIKVRALHRAYPHDLILADDSGLMIDYLNGAPGVYSARFMGEDTAYAVKNAAIIEKLAPAVGSERAARFVCAIAIAYPDGREETIRATMEGEIAKAAAGAGGFGYDPIFFLPEYGMTSAELTAEEKNRISHRGKALGLAKNSLLQWVMKTGEGERK